MNSFHDWKCNIQHLYVPREDYNLRLEFSPIPIRNFSPFTIYRKIHNNMKIIRTCGIFNSNVTYCPTSELINHAVYSDWKLAIESLLRLGSYITYDLLVPLKFIFQLVKLATKIGSQHILKMLLTFNQDLLHHALVHSLEDIVEILLENGADANSVNEDGFMPLHVAAQSKSLKNVQLLIKYGANVNVRGLNDLLAIHFAILNKRATIVQFLIRNGSYVNGTVRLLDYYVFTIHLAIQAGSSYIVELLVANGASVHPPKVKGRLLMDYALYFENTKILEILLKAGADIHSRNDYGELPIHAASSIGFYESIKLLKNYGADINARGPNGWHAIHFAVSNSNIEIVQYLLENDAEVNLHNDEGYAPIHIAVQAGCITIIEMLIKRGANVVAKGFDGWLPIHFAAYCKHSNAAQLLLENGGYDNSANDSGFTPIDFTIIYGCESIFKSLVKNGATVRQDSIHMAIVEHCGEMIRPLIEYGLDVNENVPFHEAATVQRVVVSPALIY